MGWKDTKQSLFIGIDALIVVLTIFFVLMTGLDLVGADPVEDYSAWVVLISAIGLSLSMTLRFIISVLSGKYS